MIGDKKATLTIFLVLCSLSVTLTNIVAVRAAEDSWETMTEMPTARHGLGVAVVDDKIYAIGGFNGHCLGVNEMYDPATDTWTTKRSMPTPRVNFGIAVVENKIYCIGGSTKNVVGVGANEVYDPLTDTWETKTPMPTNRSLLDANVVDGEIFLIGGYRYSFQDKPSSHKFDLNEVYDPSNDTWTTKEPLPQAVYSYASAVVDNKIYVIGGSPLNLTQIYTPETNIWSYGNPIPSELYGSCGAATTGNMAPKRIYVLGGGMMLPSSQNYIYDPEKNEWSKGADMPTYRQGLGVAVIDDILYAIGGGSSWANWFFGANERYTPADYIPEFHDGTGETESFPTLLVIAVTVTIVTVFAVGLLAFYLKKRRQKHEYFLDFACVFLFLLKED